jgi:magnesium-protoporphyrin O-methyltransferase
MAAGAAGDQVQIARHFDRKASEGSTQSVEQPVPISARLEELLSDVADTRPSVLDLGCGTGATAIRLAERGARSITGIDLSPASIEVARRRATIFGLDPEQAHFDEGDAASAVLQPHDWVVLDRVICCYGDVDRLLTNALTAAPRRLAFSVPESRGWRGLINAVIWTAENVWKAVTRADACRGHVHDVRRVEARLERAGLRKHRTGWSGLWYAAAFERPSSKSAYSNGTATTSRPSIPSKSSGLHV